MLVLSHKLGTIMNKSIYLDNIKLARNLFKQHERTVMDKLCSQVTTKILEKIENVDILPGDIVTFEIMFRGPIIKNGETIGPVKYLTSQSFKEEVVQKLQTSGSSAISIRSITASPSQFVDINAKDEATQTGLGACCLCCPCILLPYVIYRAIYGTSYACIVHLDVTEYV